MSLYAQLLSNRQFLSISGQDASSFLQGLITNDIYQLKEGALLYTALLNSKGRFLYDFFIIKKGEGYLLDTPKNKTTSIFKYLSLYKLRARVEIKEQADSYDVLSVWGKNASKNENYFYKDPRENSLGYRAYNSPEVLKSLLSNYEKSDYRYNCFLNGIPESEYGLVEGKTIPLEANLEQLHAISFEKGCYIGQELTARTHHQGLIRKRLLPFKSTEPISVGSSLFANDTIEIGPVVASYKDLGFVRARLEKLNEIKESSPIYFPKWLSF